MNCVPRHVHFKKKIEVPPSKIAACTGSYFHKKDPADGQQDLFLSCDNLSNVK